MLLLLPCCPCSVRRRPLARAPLGMPAGEGGCCCFPLASSARTRIRDEGVGAWVLRRSLAWGAAPQTAGKAPGCCQRAMAACRSSRPESARQLCVTRPARRSLRSSRPRAACRPATPPRRLRRGRARGGRGSQPVGRASARSADGASLARDPSPTDARQHVEALQHATKHHVLAVALRRGAEREEEARRVGVLAAVGLRRVRGAVAGVRDRLPDSRSNPRNPPRTHRGPARTMDSTPAASCFSLRPAFSSLNLPPWMLSPPEPSPARRAHAGTAGSERRGAACVA